MVDPVPETRSGLLDRYQPVGAFDEAFDDDGSVRATYSRIVERFRELDVDEIKRLEAYDLDMPADAAPINPDIAASIKSVPDGVLPKGKRAKGKGGRKSGKGGKHKSGARRRR